MKQPESTTTGPQHKPTRLQPGQTGLAIIAAMMAASHVIATLLPASQESGKSGGNALFVSLFLNNIFVILAMLHSYRRTKADTDSRGSIIGTLKTGFAFFVWNIVAWFFTMVVYYGFS